MKNLSLKNIFIVSLVAVLLVVPLVSHQVFAQGEAEGEAETENQTPGTTNDNGFESDITDIFNGEVGDNGNASSTEEDAAAAADEANKIAREALVAERDEDNEIADCEQEYDVKEKNGGGRFVPVKEVEGMLMQFARDTNQQVGKINLVNQQMCMHLRALKRVAYKFEVAEFLEKPQLRTVAGQAINEYKKQLFNFVNTGYQSDFRENSPQFVDDQEENFAEGAAEATVRVIDAVNKTSSPHKDVARSAIQKQIANNIETDLSCPISAEDIRKANDPKSDMKASQRLDTLLVVKSQPGCSPRGTYLKTMNLLSTEIADENANRKLSYLASGGYKPIRECMEQNANGECLKYRATVPVSAIKDTVGSALTANLERYLNAQPGDVDKENANGPQLPELRTLTPSYSGDIAMPTGKEEELNSGLKPPTGTDPEPGTGGSGGGGGAGNIGDNFNLVDFLEDYLDFSLPTDPAVPDQDTLQNLDLPPLIFTYFRTPSEADLNNDPNLVNHVRLSWMSLNAKECKVGNNWLGGTFMEDSVEAVYDAGDKIDIANSKVIDLPLTFYAYLTREREVVTDNNVLFPDETTTDTDNFILPTSVNKKLNQTTSIDFHAFDVRKDDIFTLHIKTASGSFEDVFVKISDQTGFSDMVAQFQTAIVGAGSSELQNYKFVYDHTGGKIHIVTEPKYTIICENDKGVSSKTITVERR